PGGVSAPRKWAVLRPERLSDSRVRQPVDWRPGWRYSWCISWVRIASSGFAGWAYSRGRSNGRNRRKAHGKVQPRKGPHIVVSGLQWVLLRTRQSRLSAGDIRGRGVPLRIPGREQPVGLAGLLDGRLRPVDPPPGDNQLAVRLVHLEGDRVGQGFRLGRRRPRL